MHLTDEELGILDGVPRPTVKKDMKILIMLGSKQAPSGLQRGREQTQRMSAGPRHRNIPDIFPRKFVVPLARDAVPYPGCTIGALAAPALRITEKGLP